MTDLYRGVQLLALLVQACGAALIGLLCLMLNRVVRRPALSAWVRGWLSLSTALLALLTEQLLPETAAFTLPLYLFGEYLFGYWMLEGCVHFGARHWPNVPRRLLPLLALIAMVLPQWIGYAFRSVFLLQSLVLTAAFAAGFWALRSAPRTEPPSPGLLAMRLALLSLCAVFAAYVPIFAANIWWERPLPMTLLGLSSAAHLLLEFLLGFGGAVLVLEQSHHRLLIHNGALVSDNIKFREQAERDALTGAFNRHAFFHLLEGLKAANTPPRGSAAMIDVDGLKQLNDSLGHVLGDAALVRVAQCIAQLVRPGDRVFRWGGDEFLMLALDQPAANVLVQLEQLNAALAVPGGVSVQVSFGVVEFGASLELSDAVQRADAYMYARKRERTGLAQRARRHQDEESSTDDNSAGAQAAQTL